MSGSNQAVFLSYASQDAEAAKKICDALRAAGVEVWFDQNELVGGDVWDAKIRRQISECGLFLPIISANTEARLEGYFRLEWKLAANRTHTMADEKAFLLPIVIDGTRDAGAKVPAEFRAVQWTRLLGGETGAEFGARLKRLLGPETGPNLPVVKSSDELRSAPIPTLLNEPRVEDVRKEDRARSAATGYGSLPAERRSPVKWIAAAAILLALGVAAYVVLLPKRNSVGVANAEPARGGQAQNSKALDSASAKSIAVLPFANLSADRDNEYFSDGLSENILDKLARNPGLRVMARTSSFSYKGKSVPIAQIARELNVGTIIEGSVQRSGARLRVMAQLINAADGTRVWSETFDREMTDVFAVQDEIALNIAARLQPGRAAPATEQRLTANLEAYDAYLRGRAHHIRAASERLEAVKFYERAVALDPMFALAWARLADARLRLFQRGIDQSPEVVSGTRTAIERALAAQPDQPDALIVRANVMLEVDHDYVAVQTELERIKALQPPSAELKHVEWALARDTGNWPDAERFMREGLALDPQNGDFTNNYAGPYAQERGDYTEADRLFTLARPILWPRVGPTGRQTRLRVLWRGPEEALQFLDKTFVGQGGRTAGDPFQATEAGARAQYRAELLVLLGQLTEARALLGENSVRPMLGFSEVVFFAPPLLLLVFDVGAQDRARAEAEKDQATAHSEFARGNHAPSVWRTLATADIILGHRDSALKTLGEWRRDMQRHPSIYQRHIGFNAPAAKLYARLGLSDEAVALLRESLANGFQPDASLRHAPDFAPVRTDPRFQELIRQQEAWAKAQPDPIEP